MNKLGAPFVGITARVVPEANWEVWVAEQGHAKVWVCVKGRVLVCSAGV